LPFVSLSTLVALLGLLLVPLYARWLRHTGRLGALAVGLQVGGALSNLADRVVAGTSLDYLPVGTVVFNLADVALVLGMVLAVGLLAGRRELARANAAPGRDAAAEQAGSPGR
ncbi:MAG TPA: signal peptidase II, partial [Chloroflexota bacterium]|nr:signal peptidase II [Chloroflexota bacterium]